MGIVKHSGAGDADLAGIPHWIKKSFPYSFFAAAATTSQKTLFTLPAHMVIHDALIECVEDFAGGAVSAATFAVGIAADPDKFVEETNVFTGATNGTPLNVNQDTGATTNDVTKGARGAGLWDETSGAEHPKMGYHVGTSNLAVTGDLVTTTANVNALTAGKVTVMLLVSEPRKAIALP